MGPTPKPPKVQKVAATPKEDDPAIEEARRRELELQSQSRGRASTILTGADGDTSQADVQKKQLKRFLGDD